MAGLFITLEGADGVGKSTQAQLLKEFLEAKNIEVLTLREPGSTVIGEQIRQILKNTDNKNMANYTEAYLFAAARAQIVEEIIKPQLAKGEVIVCDRFVDSSIVYQGIARGLGAEKIAQINHYATEGITPDITFLIDTPPQIANWRKEDSADRIEEEGLAFQDLVYQGYKSLAGQHKDRYIILDGTCTIDQIHQQIVDTIIDTAWFYERVRR